MGKIKPKMAKNIFFKKMIGRKDYEKKPGTANIYDCNINLIKPRRSAQVNFSLNKGR
jgi:hypothetical protein